MNTSLERKGFNFLAVEQLSNSHQRNGPPWVQDTPQGSSPWTCTCVSLLLCHDFSPDISDI